MLKYIGYSIVFQEVPDEIALALNISGCPYKCEGCHSQYLWKDEGRKLIEDLPQLIEEYSDYISCVCFMGGDYDLNEMILALTLVRKQKLKTCLYSGNDHINHKLYGLLDYYKVGAYKTDLGGLDSKNTNQRFYKILKNHARVDITYRFQKNNF